MKKLLGVTMVAIALGCSSGTGGTGGGAGGAAGGGAGGSGGTGGAGGGATTVAEACKDYTKALCDYYFRCPITPRGNEVQVFATAAECYAKDAFACEKNIARPGTTYTGADLQACLTKLNALPCTLFPDFSCPQKVGTKAEASECGAGDECASGACTGAKPTQCGTCVAVKKVGDACTSNPSNCFNSVTGSELTCVASQCKEAISRKDGESCDASKGEFCGRDSSCTNGMCVSVYGVAGAGESCESNKCKPDLVCEPVISDGGMECRAFKVFSDSEDCSASSQARRCAPGKFCIRNAVTDGGFGEDRCQTPAVYLKAGDDCVGSSEKVCEPGLECRGTCVAPQPFTKTCN